MTVVGHHAVRVRLERDLPPVVLLCGPRSIGKTTLALHLAGHHRVQPADIRQIAGTLSVEDVRDLKRWAVRAGLGPFKLAVACLDGASVPAMHALLKILEEPPASARFLLTAAGQVLPTIASRCRVYPLGRLSTDELAQVLCRQGVPAARATLAAGRGDGQVDIALAHQHDDATRATVLDLVRAVAGHDTDLLLAASAKADDNVRDLLELWLCEAITRRFVVFTEADMHELHRDQARVRRMLVNVSRSRTARPRLGIRAALQPLITGG